MTPYFWSKRSLSGGLIHLTHFREEMWVAYCWRRTAPGCPLLETLAPSHPTCANWCGAGFCFVLLDSPGDSRAFLWPCKTLDSPPAPDVQLEAIALENHFSGQPFLYVKFSNRRTCLWHRKISVFSVSGHLICKIWENSSRNSSWSWITPNTNPVV